MSDYNDDTFYEHNVELKDPCCLLMEKEEIHLSQNDYRECALNFIRIMEMSMSYILEARNPTIACWAVAYSLNLPMCDKSIRELSREMKISSGTISASSKKFKRIAGL